MHVSASERGLVRLFAVDLPSEEVEAFRESVFDGDGELIDWPLANALGAFDLDEDYIELFNVRDLEGLGLPGYMVQGLGISERDVQEDGNRLSAQRGWVLVVLSSAFGRTEQTLSPRRPLRWLGTYKEEGARVRYDPLPSAGAKGAPLDVPPKPVTSNPYKTVLLAILALPAAALVLGLLFLWGSAK
ncbi:hypothetical protein BXY66_3836 [Shimia isoporae]|uniref:Aspartate carbamoyltransferase catalytic subunit n=1 Tax=Shimia isoporae TaxID=647720 RepID=A0A4R1N0V7_9RHOB|nr:hypothetical protein [Shimia isoporae]TCK99334.1 hypothetical protein BXY66_3836 [Shimia isoporae]